MYDKDSLNRHPVIESKRVQVKDKLGLSLRDGGYDSFYGMYIFFLPVLLILLVYK